MQSPSPVLIDLPGGRGYPVHFRQITDTPCLMAEAGLRPGACVIVTDVGVARHYLVPLVQALEGAGWQPRTRIIPPGEESKSLRALEGIYDHVLEPPGDHPPPDRSTPVIALGGGVVGDLAGFAAASLLRGLPLIQIATTLLAQVDSAIGGKTGINHRAGKNLIGAIHQPAFVLADPTVLNTLPEREWASGLAEVVKAALIADPELFELLETEWEAVATRDGEVVPAVIRRAVAVKAAVVRQDEHEQGQRAILNFGHTFGHALERATGYGYFAHGEAVAIGMRAALYLSFRLDPSLPWTRLDALVARIPVPAVPDEITIEELNHATRLDKKRTAGGLRFVILEALGRAGLRADVPQNLVDAAWAFACGAARGTRL